MITFNITPSERFLAVWTRVGFVTLLPTLYPTLAHKQPVPQRCSLLQRGPSRRADLCTPATSHRDASCPRYQGSSSREHRPTRTSPPSRGTLRARPRSRRDLAPPRSCERLPAPGRRCRVPAAAKSRTLGSWLATSGTEQPGGCGGSGLCGRAGCGGGRRFCREPTVASLLSMNGQGIHSLPALPGCNPTTSDN